MRKLNTLCGEISAEEVGLICPHEHLFIDLTHEAVEPKTEAEKELFYGAVSFIDDYLAECAPAHGFVRLRQFTFDEPMREWSYTEAADNQTRSVSEILHFAF